jgi:hypothetical protein
LLSSVRVKVTCWSFEATREGLREVLQRHQRLGKRLSMVFEAKHLRFKLTNHLLGRSFKSIQGSESKMISGLYCVINFFKANLLGALAKPLVFQKIHFI